MKIGWVQPEDVDGCSSNCTLNALNNYAHEREFGFNPYELELAQLVRRNQLSRGEALAKLEDQSPEQVSRLIEGLGMRDSDFGGKRAGS